MKKSLSLIALFRQLSGDERASILLQFTVYMSVTFGMIGLALDGGRYLLLNSNLQDLADAAALAGAAELDGNNGAQARATEAAHNYLQKNNPRWSDIAGVKIQSVTFYSALNPAGDTPTNSDSNASFIKVTTGSWQVAPSFLVAVGAVSNNSTNATAVGGTNYVSCTTIQSFLCGLNFPSTAQPGAMFRLYSDSTSGNWGIVDTPGGSNPNLYTAFFAQVSPGSCSIAKASQRTGHAVVSRAVDGINVRFDQPQGSGDLSTSAPIVVDGLKPSANCKNFNLVTPPNFNPENYSATCNASTNSSQYSCPLPRDPGTPNVGSGPNAADLAAYWKNHHGSNLPAGINTRYDIYRCELGLLPGCPPAWIENPETSGPQCSATTLTGAAGLSRRILSVAITDTCPSGNSGGDFIYSKYADFFITEPADSGGTVYGELIQTYTTNSAGSKLHKTVKLYR